MLNRIALSFKYRWRGVRLGRLRRQATRVRAGAVSLLRRHRLRVLEQCPFTVATLAGKKSLEDLLLALTSLERVLSGLGPVVILSDGTLDEADAAFLSRWCPSSIIVRDKHHLVEVVECTPPEALMQFADTCVFGPKLLLGVAVQSRRNCLLMDSDVLFFQDPLRPNEALARALASARPYCMQDELESCDPAVIEHARKRGLEPSRAVNAGLMYLPKGCLDATEWDLVIPEITYRHPTIFSEQSIYAVALTQAGYNLLPPDEYVLTLEGAAFPPEGAVYRPFSDAVAHERIVCRHFVTPVRHLMWLTAFPLLAKRWHLGAEP